MMSSDADGVGLLDSHPPPPSMVVDESVQMNHVGGDAESQSEISAPMTYEWSWKDPRGLPLISGSHECQH